MSGTSRAEQYLRQLSAEDLELLASGASELQGLRDKPSAFRSHPELIEDLLARPTSFELVFGASEGSISTQFASPFLLFAVAVHRVADELSRASYVTEWFGPRQRMPVFDVTNLRDFLQDGRRRLYLVQLLSSYTHVASGSVLVNTRRGIRRQRFSELDPIRLASVLDAVPDSDRSHIYRRLGDLALFLTGVFPDHTALHGFSQIEQDRLMRSGKLRAREQRPGSRSESELGQLGVVGLLEELGPRWYKMAHDCEPAIGASGSDLLNDLARRFGDARRVLNLLTDGFLFPWRSRWFEVGSA